MLLSDIKWSYLAMDIESLWYFRDILDVLSYPRQTVADTITIKHYNVCKSNLVLDLVITGSLCLPDLRQPVTVTLSQRQHAEICSGNAMTYTGW